MRKEMDRFVILRSYLTETDQKELITLALALHVQHSPDYRGYINCCKEQRKAEEQDNGIISTSISNRTTSLKTKILQETHDFESSHTSKSLDLGLKYCGAPMDSCMSLAVDITRRACIKASCYYKEAGEDDIASELCRMSSTETLLTGIGLLYGPMSKMKAHYDSPTRPTAKEEWLVMFTIGNDFVFQMNQEKILLTSGDVVVMDAMNVLHGVVGVQKCQSPFDPALELGLGIPDSRLGILLWQASSPPQYIIRDELEDEGQELSHDLFQYDSDSDD